LPHIRRPKNNLPNYSIWRYDRHQNMPIDYSKWDHLKDESSSEDEDDESSHRNDDNHAVPRVTRLDAPSRVTFGGNARDQQQQEDTTWCSVDIQPSSPLRTASMTSPVSAATTTTTTSATSHLSSSSAVVVAKETPVSKAPGNTKGGIPDAWIERGGTVITTANQNRQLHWCQDRYSVTLRLQLLNESEKVSTVTVDGILPYRDRHAAMGTTKKPHLKCVGSNNKNNNNKNESDHHVLLLEGDLPHPVHLAEDDDDDDNTVDWSVVWDDGNHARYLQITLYKAVPMQGVFIWWKRPMMQFDERENNNNKNSQTEGTTTSASKEFLSAWEEAHKMFREKRQGEKSWVEQSTV
jgi:hypothetical protein